MHTVKTKTKTKARNSSSLWHLIVSCEVNITASIETQATSKRYVSICSYLHLHNGHSDIKNKL
jgi:hypothetical protein